MPYCTQSDILKQIAEAAVIQLTDDSGTGAIVTAVVTAAIADADAEIDAYCSGRYPVPFSPVPDMVRKLSVDIAIYNLFSRRAEITIGEDRKGRYDNSIRFLRDVSQGKASLGGDAPAETDASLPQATTAKEDRIFTRDTMEGY